jgi:hypothetical protein
MEGIGSNRDVHLLFVPFIDKIVSARWRARALARALKIAQKRRPGKRLVSPDLHPQ